jgi:hypothetical protein
MAKVVLWDDPGVPVPRVQVPSVVLDDSSVPGTVSEDPPGAEVSVNPVLTVRQRTVGPDDDDGTPTFMWEQLLVGPAVLFEERSEFDSIAGSTSVKAKATLLYDGDVAVPESVSVTGDDGVVYRVTAVQQTPGYLTLEMERIATA